MCVCLSYPSLSRASLFLLLSLSCFLSTKHYCSFEFYFYFFLHFEPQRLNLSPAPLSRSTKAPILLFLHFFFVLLPFLSALSVAKLYLFTFPLSLLSFNLIKLSLSLSPALCSLSVFSLSLSLSQENHTRFLVGFAYSFRFLMAGGTSKLLSFSFFFCLSCLTLVSSRTLVGFSYDARRSHSISSPTETISFLKKSKVFPSQIRVAVADHKVLDSLSDSGVLVDLYLNEDEMQNLRTSKASAIWWLKTQLSGAFLHGVNIRSIVVGASSTHLDAKEQLPLLLPTLETIHSVLKTFKLDDKVKVSTLFSLSILENLYREQNVRDLHQIVDFISKCGSFVILETKIDGELSMGDQFIRLITKSAISAVTAFHHRDVPIVLNVKSSAVPSSIEVAQFNEKMIESIKGHVHILDRVTGIFAEISPMQESEQKELNREEEQMFDFSRRELISNSISAMKLTQHDNMNPQTPVTTHPANPSPTTVTVPSINPGAANTAQPASPINNPVVTSPISVPSSNPVSPSTVPAGNPATPITVPSTTPPTNPVPPTGTVPMTPPSTTPTTNPLPPPATGSPSGQSWCVAKSGASDAVLQAGIDYACGIGGADCSAIQSSGSCYNPNTRQNHASYAFNSYYQKNPASTSCDFKGAATITNANPSTGSCVYPSSSSAASGGGSPPASGGGTPPASGGGTTPAAPVGAGGTPTTGVTPTVGSGGTPTLGGTPSSSSSFPGASGPTSFGTGFEPPSGVNASLAAGLKPLCAYIVLASSLFTGALMMGM